MVRSSLFTMRLHRSPTPLNFQQESCRSWCWVHFGCLYLERAFNLTTICLSYIIDGNKLRMLILLGKNVFKVIQNQINYTDHCNIYGKFWHHLTPPKTSNVYSVAASAYRVQILRSTRLYWAEHSRFWMAFRIWSLPVNIQKRLDFFACFFVFVD